MACFIECAIIGSVELDLIQRKKVKLILNKHPDLAFKILNSQYIGDNGILYWKPETNRIRAVILKLARGHAAYECSEPQLDDPGHIAFIPIPYMSKEQMLTFNAPPEETILPENGSRAFCQMVVANNVALIPHGWIVVQEGRYRYLVSYSQQITVRIVISEYLACEVIW